MNERTLACHVMLLRLAGWLPDDTIAQCRTWLAEDRLVDLAVLARAGFHKLSQSAAAVARDGDRPDGYEAALDAVALVEEVLKFIPPGADAVPAKALPHDDPADYTRQRLEALHDAYRELLLARSRELN